LLRATRRREHGKGREARNGERDMGMRDRVCKCAVREQWERHGRGRMSLGIVEEHRRAAW
jgi:hypothetical protein